MTTTEAKSLGSRIRSARLRSGLSQEALAEAIGSSRRNVMRWEGGYNEPRLSTVQAIADATGQQLDFFAEAAPSSDEHAVQDLARAIYRALHGAKSENHARYDGACRRSGDRRRSPVAT